MQAIENWPGNYPALAFEIPAFGNILGWRRNASDALVVAFLVVETTVFAQDTDQMSLIENQHVIQTFSPYGPDQSFAICVRIGSEKRNGNSPDAHGVYQPVIERRPAENRFSVEPDADGLSQLAENAVVIMEQELWAFIPGSLAYLLLQPIHSRVLGYSEINNPSAFQFHDDEDVNFGEEKGELNAEIEGPDDRGVVLEKGSPLLGPTGRLRLFDPVPIDGARRMLHAEKLLQHSGDSFAAVVRVIRRNAPDEINMLLGDGRPAHFLFRLRNPAPVVLEPAALPSNDSFRFDDDEMGFPIVPELG